MERPAFNGQKSKITSTLTDTLTMDSTRDWKFRVFAPDLKKSEVVCLTGNCLELGNWSSENVTVLKKEDESNYWYSNLTLPLDMDIMYRYCICILSQDPIRVMVRRWETHSIPRMIKKGLSVPNVQNDVFGELNGMQKVDNGWLTTQSLIQIKFLHMPVLFKAKVDTGVMKIKVTPIPLQLLADGSINTDPCEQDYSTCAVTEFAKLEKNDSKMKPQEEFGAVYNSGDILIVNVTSENEEGLAYIVDFYSATAQMPNDDPPSHVAYSHILPSDIKKTEGRIEKSIISKRNHTPFGTIAIEYIKVHPMSKLKCTLEKSYLSHWHNSWTGLNIGHRGLGSSFKENEPPVIRENTFASFNAAIAHGADLIEFDVQLSKDLVPVVYHDFHICIASKNKLQTDFNDMLEMSMKDLTQEELKILKVFHTTEGRNHKQRFFDERLPEHQPFPLLADIFEKINPSIGFNVEIKWTVEKDDGTYELDNPFELNLFVDKILEVVLSSKIPRVIVFSCFNPDVCTALRLKQNIYPVMFLTTGLTSRYPSYMDRRCHSIPAAIYHATCANLIGVVVHTEDLLRDPKQVKLVLDAGLIIFCWGDDNNNKDTIKNLKTLGLHGVIFDKMDQFSDKDVKESIFLQESREKI